MSIEQFQRLNMLIDEILATEIDSELGWIDKSGKVITNPYIPGIYTIAASKFDRIRDHIVSEKLRQLYSAIKKPYKMPPFEKSLCDIRCVRYDCKFIVVQDAVLKIITCHISDYTCSFDEQEYNNILNLDNGTYNCEIGCNEHGHSVKWGHFILCNKYIVKRYGQYKESTHVDAENLQDVLNIYRVPALEFTW